MNIIFDLVSSQPYSSSVKYNGGAQYVKNVFRQFILENHKYKNLIYCTYDSKINFDEEIKTLCLENDVIFLDINIQKLEYYAEFYNINKVYIGIAQRYLDLSFNINIKLILVVHDLRDLEIFQSVKELIYFTKFNSIYSFLKFFPILILHDIWLKYRFNTNFKRYYKLFFLANKSNLEIWTVSNHTKYVILSQFPFLINIRIKIFWSPEIFFRKELKVIKTLSNVKFFLIVASDNWEKNALKVIESFIKLNKNNSDKFNLVILGDLSFTKLKRKIKAYRWIYNFSNIVDAEMEWLYSKAEALIYLTYVEGFGYPPVQAMKYGTPVLASATSSILEICGTAPLYCCPYSQSEIFARLVFLVNNDLSEYRVKSHYRYNIVNQKQICDLSKMVRDIHS
jgi:glycosyltransferase involved in cell wall biosynthesis